MPLRSTATTDLHQTEPTLPSSPSCLLSTPYPFEASALLPARHHPTATNKMGLMDHFHHDSQEAKDHQFIENLNPNDQHHKSKLSHEVSQSSTRFFCTGLCAEC